LTETGEGIGEGDWYRRTTKWNRYRPGLPILSAITGIAAMIASSLHQIHGKEAGKIAFLPYMVLGATINAVAVAFADKFYRDNLSDVKIEPVRHKLPRQKIWLHRDGTVGIISTKGAGNNVDGAEGRIVIGVNNQEDGEDKGWRYYDKYYDFPEKKKDRDTFFQTVKKARLALIKQKKGVILSKEETGHIDLVKQKIIKKKLGAGSNIVFQKKNIMFRAGNPDNDGNADAKQLVTIGEYQDNKHGIQIHCGKTSVTIEKNGNIEIKANKNIEIKAAANKTVEIKSGNNSGFSFDGKEVKLQGNKMKFVKFAQIDGGCVRWTR